jgi:hypothetical protein
MNRESNLIPYLIVFFTIIAAWSLGDILASL